MTKYISLGVAVLALLVAGFAWVGDDTDSESDQTRFPSGIDAGALVATTFTGSGATTLGSTLAVTGATTLSGDLNYFESTEAIAADDTLTIAESGKVVYIGTAGVDLTLPTAATSDGVTYRVVVSGNFATTDMTITGGAADASDDLIFGVLTVNGALVACSAEDTISFVASAELPGDYVELHSDGTNWYVSGQAATAGGITCTDAD
jgi:hypothetical protein